MTSSKLVCGSEASQDFKCVIIYIIRYLELHKIANQRNDVFFFLCIAIKAPKRDILVNFGMCMLDILCFLTSPNFRFMTI